MNANPLVHVLVINWNGLEHLHDCFGSLVDSTYTNAKFILLDNNSEDDSVAYVREHFAHDTRVDFYLLPENQGWSGGNNEGMKAALEADADYILLLNNDTRVEPDFLEKLVDQAEADPEIGALSPRMLMFHEPQIINSLGLRASIIGAGWDLGMGRLDSLRWDTKDPIIGVCGAAMFLRASAIRDAGLLPTDFDIYLDDLDFCLRIWNAGYTIHLCYPSVVYHKFSATMGEGARARQKYYLNTRNRYRIAFLNYPASIMFFSIVMMKISAVRAICRGILDGDFWKVWVEFKASLALWRYFPRILRYRMSQGRRCQFRNLILNTPAFFPGVVFPKDGWYPPVEIEAREYTPMSQTASYHHQGGTLNVRIANPLPQQAVSQILVKSDNELLATLDDQNNEAEIAAGPGILIFEASEIIPAEDSGLLYDVGGWVSITAGPAGDSA